MKASSSRAWVTPLQTAVTFGLFAEAALAIGLAATPGVHLWLFVFEHFRESALWLQVPVLCVAGALAYFTFGIALLLVIAALRWVTFATGTPLGTYPYISWKGYQWASYNALILIVRFSFVNWLRATPINVFFYRMMGLKAGARVQVNTAVVADCNLIELGDDTVIGGDVTLVAHAVEGPNLVTAKVRIGNRVTVGIMAVILPGCEIGDDATVAAGAILKKGTRIGPGEVWGGVPAKKL